MFGLESVRAGELQQFLSFVTPLITLAAFLLAFLQYRKGQRWERAKFLAGEFKELRTDHKVQNALTMLDWSGRSVALFPEASDPSSRSVRVHHADLPVALATRGRAGFTAKEAAIRDCMDRLFERLELFGAFLQSGLATRRELEPYLRYWVALVGDPANPRLTPDVRRAVWEFVAEYGYSDVQRLFDAFGWSILPLKPVEVRREAGSGKDPLPAHVPVAGSDRSEEFSQATRHRSAP
jgi:hypothetical protein